MIVQQFREFTVVYLLLSCTTEVKPNSKWQDVEWLWKYNTLSYHQAITALQFNQTFNPTGTLGGEGVANDEMPSLSVTRLSGEFLVGGVACVFGLFSRYAMGDILGNPTREVRNWSEAYGTGLLLGILELPIGTTSGGYLIGDINDETGSF